MNSIEDLTFKGGMPWEKRFIDDESYYTAKKNIAEFLNNFKIINVETLEDLSAETSTLSDDLHVLAVVLGTPLRETIPEPNSSSPYEPMHLTRHAYELKRAQNVKSLKKETGIITDSYSVLIYEAERPTNSYRNSFGRLNWEVLIPFGQDFSAGNTPLIKDSDLYARYRNGYRAMEKIYPVSSPKLASAQQRFAGALVIAVQSVVDTFINPIRPVI